MSTKMMQPSNPYDHLQGIRQLWAVQRPWALQQQSQDTQANTGTPCISFGQPLAFTSTGHLQLYMPCVNEPATTMQNGEDLHAQLPTMAGT